MRVEKVRRTETAGEVRRQHSSTLHTGTRGYGKLGKHACSEILEGTKTNVDYAKGKERTGLQLPRLIFDYFQRKQNDVSRKNAGRDEDIAKDAEILLIYTNPLSD